MKKLLLTSCFLTVVSGCSTITNGPKEELSFSSKEEGTKFYINGHYHGENFALVKLPRGKKHDIIAKKDNCQAAKMTTDYHFQWTKSLFLNLFIDYGLVSIPMDLITGSAWESDQSHYDVTPICSNAAPAQGVLAKNNG